MRYLHGLKSDWNPSGTTRYGILCDEIEEAYWNENGEAPSKEYVEKEAQKILDEIECEKLKELYFYE